MDWLAVIEKLGYPGVFLAALYCLGRWLQPHADRMFVSHLGLVEALRETQPRNAEALAEIRQKTEEIHQVVVNKE